LQTYIVEYFNAVWVNASMRVTCDFGKIGFYKWNV